MGDEKLEKVRGCGRYGETLCVSSWHTASNNKKGGVDV